jgi:hypothetical protein
MNAISGNIKTQFMYIISPLLKTIAQHLESLFYLAPFQCHFQITQVLLFKFSST